MSQPRLESILRIIEDETGVSALNLCSKSRKLEYVQARVIFYHISRQHLLWKNSDIIAFVGRHRTMAYHAKKCHKIWMEVDKEYRMLYNRVSGALTFNPILTPIYAELSAEDRRKSGVVNKRMLIGIDV